ncbi:MAG TPA: hypothetical protein VK466_09160, partial [Terriglobales bacterium]|nr:hypothetical protein [Terriglobales bacterium]
MSSANKSMAALAHFLILAMIFACPLVGAAQRKRDDARPSQRLYVDANNLNAQLGGTCISPRLPCLRITDALAQARAIRYAQMLEPHFQDDGMRPIEIIIAPGSYVGTFGDNPDGRLEEYPLLINIPQVALRGATQLALDSRGRPAANLQPDGTLTALDESSHTVLRMKPQETRSATAFIILVLPTTDVATGIRSHASETAIEGLSFDVGAGPVIGVDRAPGFVLWGCAFASAGAVDVVNSSARFEKNLFYKGDIGIVVNMADRSQPHKVVVRDNTAIGKTNGSLYLSASGYDASSLFLLWRHASEFLYEPFLMPPQTYGKVIVENNLFTGSTANANLGFAVRIVATDGQVTAPATTGEMGVTLHGNELTNNRSGLMLDAGFPARVLSGQAEQTTGPWMAHIRVLLRDNVITGNLRSAAAMSFTRFQAALLPANLATFKYAESSKFELADPDGNAADLWVDHLELDPKSGRTLNNTFIHNGVVIPAPARSCGYPALSGPFAPSA